MPNDHLNGLFWAIIFVSQRESKRGPNSEISHIWKVYRIFILHPILMHFFFCIDGIESFQ